MIKCLRDIRGIVVTMKMTRSSNLKFPQLACKLGAVHCSATDPSGFSKRDGHFAALKNFIFLRT